MILWRALKFSIVLTILGMVGMCAYKRSPAVHDRRVMEFVLGAKPLPKSFRVSGRRVAERSWFPHPDPFYSYYAMMIEAKDFELLGLEGFRENPPELWPGDKSAVRSFDEALADKWSFWEYLEAHERGRTKLPRIYRVSRPWEGGPYKDGGSILVDETDSPTLRLFMRTTLPERM